MRKKSGGPPALLQFAQHAHARNGFPPYELASSTPAATRVQALGIPSHTPLRYETVLLVVNNTRHAVCLEPPTDELFELFRAEDYGVLRILK